MPTDWRFSNIRKNVQTNTHYVESFWKRNAPSVSSAFTAPLVSRSCIFIPPCEDTGLINCYRSQSSTKLLPPVRYSYAEIKQSLWRRTQRTLGQSRAVTTEVSGVRSTDPWPGCRIWGKMNFYEGRSFFLLDVNPAQVTWGKPDYVTIQLSF